MSVASPKLLQWLAGIREKVEETNPAFTGLNPVGWPIPFFGDLRTARVLTVGVNPSPTEFAPPSRWAAVQGESEWVHRLLNYFSQPNVPWHEWFMPWEASLRLIGCSYEDGSAAHLDLSPRATTVMRRAPRQIFCDMVASDVGWFFESLAFAPCARLVLTAGTIVQPPTGTWQTVASFVKAQSTNHGAKFERQAGVTRLITGDGSVSLPLFPLPHSPSFDDRFKLVESVFKSRAALLPFLT